MSITGRYEPFGYVVLVEDEANQFSSDAYFTYYIEQAQGYAAGLRQQGFTAVEIYPVRNEE